MMAYFGQQYYDTSHVSAADRRELAAAAKPRTAEGSDTQRLTALMLLAAAAPSDAAEIAGGLADDAKLSESLRRDAFQVQLTTESAPEARKTALGALKGSDARRKKLAMKYLVIGPEALRSLPNGLYFMGSITYSSTSSSGSPIVPQPPDGH